MMSLDDANKLIADKNWDELAKYNVFSFFAYGQNWKGLVFNESFILEYVLEKKYYNTRLLPGHTSSTVYTDDIWRKISSRIKQLDLKFTVDEWKKYINNILDVNELNVDSYALQWALKLNSKDTNYIRTLLDDDFYEKLLKIKGYHKDFDMTPPNDMFEGLTRDEKIIRDRMFFGGMFEMTSDSMDNTIFADFGKDDIDTITWLEKKTYLKPGDVFANRTSAEFELILRNKLEGNYSEYLIFHNYLNWFSNNRDVEISDEYLEYLNKNLNFIYSKIIFNLSKEQIIKNSDKINLVDQVKTKKISLSEINKLNNNKRLHVGASRFFTEEEIFENPNLFNPWKIKKRFKVLLF